MIKKAFNNVLKKVLSFESSEIVEEANQGQVQHLYPENQDVLGIIAGNSSFPLRLASAARLHGFRVVAVCHQEETDKNIEKVVDHASWIKVGELGKIISIFHQFQVKKVVLAGGINRIRLFGGVKLDLRGAALIARLRSTKDDVIMRGIAKELEQEGMQVVPCTFFSQEFLVREGILTKSQPTEDELQDIKVGIEAIQAMSNQDIGQLVVVREGVIVAVEAVEGTDETIRRGGKLGGKGTVVVKFAKPTQDMRFDVPTVGIKTIKAMIEVGSRVLALEAGRCLVLDEEEVFKLAESKNISIIGCPSLVVV